MGKKTLLILTVGLVISFSSPVQALWLSGYDYREEITIDSTKIDSNLSNLPVLVKLDATNFDFSKARSDGYDITFTSSDGETLLFYEREKYDSSGEAEYWVKIPTVSGSSDTTFYMYYGNSGASDGENANAVWDSNYKMVQHLEETSGTHYDSTSNSNNGTPYNGVNQNATGKIDGADDFDGSNDYVAIGTSSTLNSIVGVGPTTYEAWINTTDSEAAILAKRDYNNKAVILFASGGRICFEKYNGSVDDFSSGKINVADGNWHHIAVVDDTYIKIYVDGEFDNSKLDNAANSTNTGNLTIGVYRDHGSLLRLFDGVIDEVRISNSIRDEAWIKASYYSGNNSLLIFENMGGGAIPEPASFLLLGFGVAGIAIFRKRIL